MPLLVVAVLLGIIEGLTEFLPISSTGHLIVLGDWLGFEAAIGGKGRADAFEIFIQLGAILAVVVYFRERLLAALRAAVQPRGGQGEESRLQIAPTKKGARRFLAGIVVATIPAVVVKLAAGKFLDELPSPVFVAWVLIGGGAALWAVEQWRPKARSDEAENLGWTIMILIGCAQTLAMLMPGLSRSGATIMAALLLGLTIKAAAEFSFFLSIPTMFLACTYKLAKAIHEGVVGGGDWLVFAVGFAVAFVSALLVVNGFMAFLRKHGFKVFAYYRVVFGAAVLLVR